MQPVFVTGFHRAGTHSIAEQLAKQLNCPYVEEHSIQFHDTRMTAGLLQKYPDGFVLQCPFLAHKTLELAQKGGRVIWCDRNKLRIVTSLRNIGFNYAPVVMRLFHDEFPGDPIWAELQSEYSGKKEDPAYGNVAYFSLMVRMKEYFYQNKFKDHVDYVCLENWPGYAVESTETFKNPLKQREADKVIL